MTPLEITHIDVNELNCLELRCECGAAIALPLPLKIELPWAQECLSCSRPMWVAGSPVRTKIADIAKSVASWQDAGYKTLIAGFVLTKKV